MHFEKGMLSCFQGKKVLVAGGAGFIGSNLSEDLVKHGAKVGIIDGFVEHTGADRRNIQSIIDEIELYDSRVEDIASLQEIVGRFEYIIDSIALTSHNLGVDYPLLDIEINLIPHLHLINALRGTEGKKVIYLGSRGQYGHCTKRVITEETAQNPLDPQGINKFAAECYFRLYAKKYNFKFLSLRITNCFGENQETKGNDIGLVGSFIRHICQGRTVEIYGDISRGKDVIYVKDLINIILDLMRLNFEGGGAYNIAGTRVTLKSLLDSLIKIIGRGEYKVTPFPDEIKHIDIGEAEFSDKKIRNKLKELKLSSLDIALANTVRYFEGRLSEKKHNLEM